MYREETALGYDSAGGRDLTGYGVEAVDGSIGKIDKASNDVGQSYIIVDTGPWIFGKKVMLPAGVIQRVDEQEEKVWVDRTKDQIKNAPEYDEALLADSRYRSELGTYYAPAAAATATRTSRSSAAPSTRPAGSAGRLSSEPPSPCGGGSPSDSRTRAHAGLGIPSPGDDIAMREARQGRAYRGKRRARSAGARLLAVSALLLAAWVVLAVVSEAREPSAGAPASHIRPLPPSLFHP